MPLSRPIFGHRFVWCALILTICSSRVEAAVIRDPTSILLRHDDLILSDISTDDPNQSTDQAYSAAFTLNQTVNADDSLVVRFWGGVDRIPNLTPDPLDFQFRVYFDSGDGQSPSDQINSTGLHTFQQILDVQAVGTHQLYSAPVGINTEWNEYRVELTLTNPIEAGTQYWFEIGEHDFLTNVADPANRTPFYLLPAASGDGNPSVTHRDPWDGTSWRSSNPAAIHIDTKGTTPVPEPASLAWTIVLAGGIWSKRRENQDLKLTL